MEGIGVKNTPFGYHSYQSGVSIEVIQKLFNHSAPLKRIVAVPISMNSIYSSLHDTDGYHYPKIDIEGSVQKVIESIYKKTYSPLHQKYI
jgi:hypothetical protein